MERIDATVHVVKRNELHAFVVLPKRWIVERSFAWLEKCRRLWNNCERKLNTSLQMIHLVSLNTTVVTNGQEAGTVVFESERSVP